MTPQLLVSIPLFLEALDQGTAKYAEAARILVHLHEQDPEVLIRIVEDRPQITLSHLRKFLRIGQNQLLAECAFAESSGHRALSRMEIADQRKYMAEPVEVLISNDGKTETLLVAVEHLTRDQVRQVFARDHVRSLGEQRAWLESQRAQQLPPVAAVQPFTVHKHKVVVNRPCILSREDVVRLVIELSK